MTRIGRRISRFTREIDRDYLESKYETLLFLGEPGLDFFVLMSASAAIAAAGFVMDSPSVIIGAMVISPLLHPVVLLGSALARGDLRHGLSLLGIAAIGIAVAMVVAIGLGFVWPSFDYGSEITTRLAEAPALYALVAFASGVAGAFAFYWPDIAESIPGVSISVALLPPVVMVGLAISRLDTDLLTKSTVILVVNLVGLTLSAALVTRFLWWYGARGWS